MTKAFPGSVWEIFENDLIVTFPRAPHAYLQRGLARFKRGPDALRAHLQQVLAFELPAERLEALLAGADTATLAESLALGTALGIPSDRLRAPAVPAPAEPADADLPSPAHQVTLQALRSLLKDLEAEDLPLFLRDVSRTAEALKKARKPQTGG